MSESVLTVIEYLRTEFPGSPIGHRRLAGRGDLFFVGPHERLSSCRLLLPTGWLRGRPLDLIVKLQRSGLTALRDRGATRRREEPPPPKAR